MYVFFFKQKSAYDVRISDWSSDVCSSDLAEQQYAPAAVELRVDLRDVVHGDVEALDLAAEQEHPVEAGRGEGVDVARDVAQRRRPAEDAGRAGARIAALVGERTSGGTGQRVHGRGGPGGRRLLKEKNRI